MFPSLDTKKIISIKFQTNFDFSSYHCSANPSYSIDIFYNVENIYNNYKQTLTSNIKEIFEILISKKKECTEGCYGGECRNKNKGPIYIHNVLDILFMLDNNNINYSLKILKSKCGINRGIPLSCSPIKISSSTTTYGSVGQINIEY